MLASKKVSAGTGRAPYMLLNRSSAGSPKTPIKLTKLYVVNVVSVVNFIQEVGRGF